MYFHIITFQIFFPGSINYYIINKIYYISIKHNKWVKKNSDFIVFYFYNLYCQLLNMVA